MALVTVTPTQLVAGTPGADMVAGANLSATITGGTDTFVITPVKNTWDLIIFISYTGAAVVTFNAGDNPPSIRAIQGNLVLAAGVNAAVQSLVLQGGRFIQDDGTITGSVATANCKMGAYILPRKDS